MSSMLVPSGSYLAMNVLAVEMLYVQRSKRYANLLRKQVGVGPWDGWMENGRSSLAGSSL